VFTLGTRIRQARCARGARLFALVIGLALVAGGCSGATGSAEALPVVRLGYFPNITHAAAVVGVERGLFQTALGSGARLEPATFNAGGDEITALFSDALDIGYIGPSPAVNAWAKSKGEAIRIIAGSTSGGAALIVKASIKTAADLRGASLATPQLGNTQDVALRAWLASNDLVSDLQGGGDVHIRPQENPQTLEGFKAGAIDGAWVPEPWASRLVLEGGGHVLVNERSLWPGGRYATTLVIVRAAFLREHADLVKQILQGHVAAISFLNDHRTDAQRIVGEGIAKITGKSLAPGATSPSPSIRSPHR